MKTMYKVIFNYYAGRKRQKANPSLMAWLAVSFSFVLLGFNITGVISILTYQKILYSSMPYLKPGIIAFMGCMYYLMFNVFKYSKDGDQEDNTFYIDSGVAWRVWTVVVVNFALVFAIPMLIKYYFQIV